MNTVRLPALILSLAAFILLAACGRAPAGLPRRELTVAAAADLTPAFEEVGRIFEQATGTRVVFSFGSTGSLAKQIEHGAPVDLFAAANVSFIDGLERKGLIVPGTKALYARGRITLWAAAGGKVEITKLEDLARPEVTKVALANPEHAPYGVAAREALQSLGLWEQVRPKCVYGTNVRQALQFAETGNVDAAIVALSLSRQGQGRWFLVPEHLHKPLDQALAVIKNSPHEREARQFAAFISGEQGRPVMRKYGFLLPGEESRP
jgi:molybdate transport system substrate-binding protein